MSIALQTSERGVVSIKAIEGEVLKAYLCPANHWTIGSGHTSMAGPPIVKPGMTITREQSAEILRSDLRKFEARVAKHVDVVKRAVNPQAAFDGSVSFDFNTGRIHNATWVKLFNSGEMKRASDSLMTWVKGGGKVLPGLKRRRAEEDGMIFAGLYPMQYNPPAPAIASEKWATWVILADLKTQSQVRETLRELGYDVGNQSGKINRAAIEAFQRKYDLTVDGRIGRATLSTLQREIDARSRSKSMAVRSTAGGAVAGGNEAAAQIDPAIALDPSITTAGLAVAVIGVLCLAVLAYRYRDVIAVRVQHRLPRVAAWLRSF